ncbi:MAG: hypothetical protein R2695_20385 [Acidimicrobiales bacterium]
MLDRPGADVDGLGRGGRCVTSSAGVPTRSMTGLGGCSSESGSSGVVRGEDIHLLGDVEVSALGALVRRSLLAQERDGLEPATACSSRCGRWRRPCCASGNTTRPWATSPADSPSGRDEHGARYWDWQTLDELRPLLPTYWAAVDWLEQGATSWVLTFVAGFAGVANVYSDAIAPST